MADPRAFAVAAACVRLNNLTEGGVRNLPFNTMTSQSIPSERSSLASPNPVHPDS